VLRSISRLANDLSGPDEKKARQTIRELLATYAENEDLVTIGAYRKGANRTLDAAVEMREAINNFLKQMVEQTAPLDVVRRDMLALANQCQLRLAGAMAPVAVAQAPLAAQAAAPPPAAKKRPTVIKRA
jgi:flagellum-specific ATP synthase